MVKWWGETLGYAIYALKTKQPLLTDRVVELNFDLTETDAFFIIVSDELDCTFTLDGVVQTTDGDLLEYIDVDNASPEQILAQADRSPDVREARCITTPEEASRFEFDFKNDTTALKRLIERGAAIKTGVTTNGQGTLIAEVPTAADIRPFVEAVQTVYPEATLTAKREYEHTDDSPTSFREQIYDQLTDRQYVVLQTAYFAGYFEFPRESTGEKLANTLGISAPTFHQHLQAAHRKLLTVIFANPSANR